MTVTEAYQRYFTDRLLKQTDDLLTEGFRWVESTHPWYSDESKRPRPDTGSDYWQPPQ